jgi:hypothetical protein
MDILHGYATSRQLADLLEVKESTVARWRRLRIGPRWVYRGKTPFADVDEWRDWLRAGGFKPHSRKRAKTQHTREERAAA